MLRPRRSDTPFEVAERLSRQVLDARLRVLGAEHPDTLRSMCQLEVILRYQRKFAEAEPLIRQAVETSRRVLGDEHQVTRETMTSLAGQLQSQGKLDDALRKQCPSPTPTTH